MAIQKTTLFLRTIKRGRAQRYQKPKSSPLLSDIFVLMDNLLARISTFTNKFPLVKSLFLAKDTCNVLDFK